MSDIGDNTAAIDWGTVGGAHILQSGSQASRSLL
jgi:hypothetical protein